MLPGERWRHRQTRELVRIEVQLLGLLSFSILRDGKWTMCRHPWDENQFREEFELVCPEIEIPLRHRMILDDD